MKIGFDARLIHETGVGRYIRNLLRELGRLDREHAYVVYLPRREFEAFVLPNRRWQKRLSDIPWHSVREQVLLPLLYLADGLDLLHVPYFNVPIFYPKRFVVTIHDLTILHVNTGRATTLPLPLYRIRRLGYLLALRSGIGRARHILTVSETTKQEIVSHFSVIPSRVSVAYEGVDDALAHASGERTRLIPDPYFLYVGNAYPHKNVESLIQAFLRFVNDGKNHSYRLVLVGQKDFFYRRLAQYADSLGANGRIVFWGPADDRQLASLYANASAFVSASLMEGFGLPPLEALSFGCRVTVSDIPAFREILGDSADYFNPHDIRDMHRSFIRCTDKNRRTDEAKRKLLSRYRWKTMAEQTLAVYRQAIA